MKLNTDGTEEPLSPADTNLELKLPYLDSFETDFQNQVQMEEEEEKKRMEKQPREVRQPPLAIRFRSERAIHPSSGNFQDNMQLLKQKMQRNRQSALQSPLSEKSSTHGDLPDQETIR